MIIYKIEFSNLLHYANEFEKYDKQYRRKVLLNGHTFGFFPNKLKRGYNTLHLRLWQELYSESFYLNTH